MSGSGWMGSKSEIEDHLETRMRQLSLPSMEREYRFAANHVGLGPGLRRRLAYYQLKDWRFDFADLKRMIAVECEGGTYSGGRHVRGAGYEDDCEKYNHAAKLGWRVYRFTSAMVKDDRAILFLTSIYSYYIDSCDKISTSQPN
jgi:very-short-patch-repair endonuclease